jgi:hypothetical protein
MRDHPGGTDRSVRRYADFQPVLALRSGNFNLDVNLA